MSSSAKSAEVAFDARTACASLIACCATAVALSRIDCGSEAFALTSVSNERAVCRRTAAEAKDIHFGNDAYKSFPTLYHVFVLLHIHAPLLFSPTALLQPGPIQRISIFSDVMLKYLQKLPLSLNLKSMDFVFVIVALLIYFLPSVVARKKKNAGAIFILNLFLGWTLLGKRDAS